MRGRTSLSGGQSDDGCDVECGEVGMVARRAALLVAVCMGVQLALPSPAFAAGTVTVTPSTNLANGQTVTVAGSGWTPAAPGQTEVCETIASATPNGGDCSGVGVTLSLSGSFSTPFKVQQTIFVPSLGRTVNCATEKNCVIEAFTSSDFAGTVTQTAALTSWVQPRPDGRMRRWSDGAILFNNVYQ